MNPDNRLARWQFFTTFEIYNPDSAVIDAILLTAAIVAWTIC